MSRGLHCNDEDTVVKKQYFYIADLSSDSKGLHFILPKLHLVACLELYKYLVVDTFIVDLPKAGMLLTNYL